MPRFSRSAVDLAVPAERVAALARGAERHAPDLLDPRHGASQQLALAGHAHDEDADRLGLRRRRDRRLSTTLVSDVCSDCRHVRRASDDGDVERARFRHREPAPARLEGSGLRCGGVGPEVDRRIEDGLEAWCEVVDGQHAAPPVVRTKPSWSPPGDHAGIRSGSAEVMGAGAGVSAVSSGNEIVWTSASDPSSCPARRTGPRAGWRDGPRATPRRRSRRAAGLSRAGRRASSPRTAGRPCSRRC